MNLSQFDVCRSSTVLCKTRAAVSAPVYFPRRLCLADAEGGQQIHSLLVCVGKVEDGFNVAAAAADLAKAAEEVAAYIR